MPLEATLRPKDCAVCGTEFKPTSARQKYCSTECKQGTASCWQCGERFIKTKGTTGRFCSSRCWYDHVETTNYRECVICGDRFKSTWTEQKTCGYVCSSEIRYKKRTYTHCAYCEKPIRADAPRTQRYCSKSCGKMGRRFTKISGRHPVGTVVDTHGGYKKLKVGHEYPNNRKGWLLEHRYVMEQLLGRSLELHERVHHKDGDKANNAPDNLELWSKPTGGHPNGQRPDDLLDALARQAELLALTQDQRIGVLQAVKRVFRYT